MGESGGVVWITGLSGAGKTTLANRVFSRLQERGICVVHLDGDILRDIFGKSTNAHTRDERLSLALSYAHLCRQLSLQGVYVVCATVSMFAEVYEWNQANLQNYRQIYLRVPLDELHRRDSKELYSRALKGEISNIAGMDLQVDEPSQPDLIIDNHGECTADIAERLAMDFLDGDFFRR